ncbi:MAG: helicase HerA-like domain-containing protein, partial [Fimbriimonadaceae bacterium]
GPCDSAVRQSVFNSSPLSGKYDKMLDRESAYEKLQAIESKREQEEAEAASQAQVKEQGEPISRGGATRRTDSVFESMAKSVVRAAGSQLGRSLIRGVFGNLLGGSRRRR